jgi:hypothetical protein
MMSLPNQWRLAAVVCLGLVSACTRDTTAPTPRAITSANVDAAKLSKEIERTRTLMSEMQDPRSMWYGGFNDEGRAQYLDFLREQLVVQTAFRDSLLSERSLPGVSRASYQLGDENEPILVDGELDPLGTWSKIYYQRKYVLLSTKTWKPALSFTMQASGTYTTRGQTRPANTTWTGNFGFVSLGYLTLPIDCAKNGATASGTTDHRANLGVGPIGFTLDQGTTDWIPQDTCPAVGPTAKYKTSARGESGNQDLTLTWMPSEGSVSFSFDASPTTIGDGAISRYAWSIQPTGGGAWQNIGTAATASFTAYPNGDDQTWNVSLNVTDANGKQSTTGGQIAMQLALNGCDEPIRSRSPAGTGTLQAAAPGRASFDCAPTPGDGTSGGYDGGLCYCQQWFLVVRGQIVDEWWDCYDETGNPIDSCRIS